ncbi:rabphilin-3A-like isoform X1 [Ornithodoros turicata]|uniref:rabphilin-3A-like isoform X1 n=1 Tax=Ornithodoros turicata TaxID=34597 RepID=UPI0031392946
MTDYSERDKWVCPNDRELALRAKLHTGWSVKTGGINSFSKVEQMSDTDQEVIVDVIKRADMLERIEQHRVGRLVERVENMKRNALGNGTTQCLLCAEEFGLLSSSPMICNDCRKAVCSKCCVDTFSVCKEQIWLCMICSETREMWKKSGAWFYHGMPNYIPPEKKDAGTKFACSKGNGSGVSAHATKSWHKGQAEKESTDSSDDEMRGNKVNRRVISRKALYDSTDSSDSSTSNKVAFPSSPERFEQGASSRDTASALQCSTEGDLTSFYNELICMSDSSKSPASRHSEVAPWLQRRQNEASKTDSEEEQLDSEKKRHALYISEDRSADSISSIGTTGRYVTAHPPRNGKNDPFDDSAFGSVYEDDRRYSGDSSPIGTLEFSLLLLNSGQALKCTIHRAKHLRGTDLDGLADPFVSLELLPCSRKAHEDTTCVHCVEEDVMRTKTVHRTVNPEFNETLTFQKEEDLSKRTLRLTIFDEYHFGNCFLGEVVIPLRLLRPNHMGQFSVQLEKCSDEELLYCEKPRILLSLLHSCQGNMLFVGIVRCVNLPEKDRNSDPFVKICLKPDIPPMKHKTSIKRKTLNPEFNEEFAFKLGNDLTLEKRFLQVSVWDYGRMDEYIGGLELGVHCKGEQLQHWLDVVQYPEQRFERWHTLASVPP